MATITKILLPRRGKYSKMNGVKASTVLHNGEFFIELPDTGAGTGKCKIKIGDGSTQYSELPYAIGDTSSDKIEFVNNTATTVTNCLNSVVTGAELKTIVAALKQAISLVNDSVTQLNDDLADKVSSSDLGTQCTMTVSGSTLIINPKTN